MGNMVRVEEELGEGYGKSVEWDEDTESWEINGNMFLWKTTSLEMKTFLEVRLRSLYPFVAWG